MNKAIVISEIEIIETVDGMCSESLCPETHDAWLSVKAELELNRQSMKAIDTAMATPTGEEAK